MTPRKITIGTRGSELAMRQAHKVRIALESACPGCETDVQVIHTTGDKRRDLDLRKPGESGVVDKGVFTKELEEALLDKRVDMAVHSSKDVPTEMDPRLSLAAFLPREDVRDVIVSVDPLRDTMHLARKGLRIGTSSPRRERQLRAMAPGTKILPIRGNVPTRIRKLETDEYDAVVLAAAGILRLGLVRANGPLLALDGKVWPVLWLDPKRFLPAAGQGAVAVQIRSNDPSTAAVCKQINDEPTRLRVESERHFLDLLGAGCQTPIGVYTRIRDSQFLFFARLYSESEPDKNPAEVTLQGPVSDSLKLAQVARLQLP